MLSHVANLGPGIEQVALTDLWREIQPGVAAVLGQFYEQPVPLGYYPHFNEAGLRLALLGHVKPLAGLSRELSVRFKEGAAALVIDELHLAGFEPAVRAQLLYALALAMGFPTPSNQRQATLLWTVKPQPATGDRDQTYSEHSELADLHSDSQAYPVPEEFFYLYAVHAARCGGGVSQLCSAGSIVEALSSSAEGRAALEVLQRPVFPFFISAGSAAAGNADAVTVAPILGDRPAIRFRRDVLEAGFGARPDLDTPEARQAVAVLLATLGTGAPVVEHLLRDDAIVLCNNWALLHGRTRFEDQERYLVRVRMASLPVAVHMARFLEQNQFFARAVVG